MASKQPTNYESLKAGDTAQPLVKDMLRMPGWEPTYVEIPIHWYHNNQWHNANYVAVTGHIVRKNTQGETWERPITVFVDSMIYNPRYAYLETSPNLYKSSESVKVKSTNNVAGSEYLEFIDLHFRSYDIQYAKVPIDTSAGKNSYFLVIQPLLRVINAVSGFTEEVLLDLLGNVLTCDRNGLCQ
jgi:hypothetical protein